MNIPSKYYFDKKAADRAVTWIEKYATHVKGELAGKPIILQDWQKKDIIEPIFGWKDRLTKLRKHRTVYIEIPRKNAKSTLAAALGLLLLLADGEPGAEIFSAAADRGQAGIVFDVARRMVHNKKALNTRANVWRNSITYEKTGSFYKAISADAKTKHGFNAHGIIFDELHTQPNRELYDVLTTSVGSRRQPLTVLLTTAGTDRTSICWEIHEYARKVKEGIIIDDTFLGIIYTAPKEMDIFSIDTWTLANPGFGSIVKKQYIEQEAQKVKNNPNYENTFRQLHLNQWTSSLETWIPDDIWMKCNKGQFSIKDYYNYDCVLGMDLADRGDTTSLAVIILKDNEPIAIFPYIWVPEEKVDERFRRGDKLFKTWMDQGYLHVTPGNTTDYRAIINTIAFINERMNIIRIGFDDWNSSQMIIELMDIIDQDKLDKVGMSISKISEPTKRFHELVLKQSFNHGGHPVLRWMVSNVIIFRDTNLNIRPSKKSSPDKIDGVVAIIVALTTLWSEEAEENLNEIFKNRGFTSS